MLTSEYLVRLRCNFDKILDVIKKKTDGLFSDNYKVLLFFDYILTNS